MRRSGRRANSPLGISLFPFLAVLLCTMGSLIVLLICLVQRAGSDAPEAAVEEASVVKNEGLSAEELARLESAADDAEFVARQLKQKKDEFSQALARMREEMGIAERLLREKQDEAKFLQAQAEAIRAGGATEEALDAAQERIEQVKEEIAKLEKEQKRKEVEQKNKPKRMSIIPHRGKNGTMQQPIYVECRADKVVILPEGIEFSDDDFIAAKSAGNPLDASLRAVREYFAVKTKESGSNAPYPLFIVRPGGDIAFLKARAAIVSWEDEFGYELVDDTVVLEYPPADPKLAELLTRASNDARKRQEALARALPGRFRSGNSGSGSGSPTASQSNGGGAAGAGLGGAGSKNGSNRFGSAQGAKPQDGTAEPGVGGPDSRFVDGVAPNASQKSRFVNGPTNKAAAAKPGEAPVRHGATKAGDPNGTPSGEGGAAAIGEVQSRGKNWANKGADVRSTPVTRTISATCTDYGLTFLPPKGTPGKPIVIEWAGNPVDVVDRIALQVNNRISGWGMAIGGGYWQPVLMVDVAPSGEERYAELAKFFDNSGIEVRRKVR